MNYYSIPSISRLIRLMVVVFTCHNDLTCPQPGRAQTNDNVFRDVEVIEQMAPPQAQPTVGYLIQCLLKCQQWFAFFCCAGQQDGQRDTGDWYTAVAQRTTGWRWTLWLGGSRDAEKRVKKRWGRSRWQSRGLTPKWQSKWNVGVREKRGIKENGW